MFRVFWNWIVWKILKSTREIYVSNYCLNLQNMKKKKIRYNSMHFNVDESGVACVVVCLWTRTIVFTSRHLFGVAFIYMAAAAAASEFSTILMDKMLICPYHQQHTVQYRTSEHRHTINAYKQMQSNQYTVKIGGVFFSSDSFEHEHWLFCIAVCVWMYVCISAYQWALDTQTPKQYTHSNEQQSIA